MTVSAMRATAATDDEWEAGQVAPQLSTDYLNRYGEALMLLEMVPMDPDIVADLQAWQPVGYRAHFATSQLRCAQSALAAYDGLDAARRAHFEALCGTMNRVIATVTALMTELKQDEGTAEIVDVASQSLRDLIGRATQFINANGGLDIGQIENRVLQDDIDALFTS